MFVTTVQDLAEPQTTEKVCLSLVAAHAMCAMPSTGMQGAESRGRGCRDDSRWILLVVVDLVEDGAHEQAHDGSEDEAGAIVGHIAVVADPELPEDHTELGEVGLWVLGLERQGLAPLLRNAQLLDQLLILPARDTSSLLSDHTAICCCHFTLTSHAAILCCHVLLSCKPNGKRQFGICTESCRCVKGACTTDCSS